MDCWKEVNTENVEKLSDIEGYWEDFYHMFGFHLDNVDYSRDVEIQAVSYTHLDVYKRQPLKRVFPYREMHFSVVSDSASPKNVKEK